MKYFKLFSFTLTCLFFANISNAWHIVGGEMSYECLGNDQYKITTQIYQETSTQTGGFIDPLLLSVFDGNGQPVSSISNPISVPFTTILTNTNHTFCSSSPLNLEVVIYTTTLTLPANTSGYHVSYQRCCLNASLSNVLNPSTTGITLTSFISPIALSTCNSSPTFNQNPASTFCIGNPITMDYSGTDIDGDSLVYSFVSPFTGLSQTNPSGVATAPPYTAITFIPPFSANQPLGTNVALDSMTGILSGNFTTMGNYYFGVTVADYQNGILLSKTSRFFLVKTTACSIYTDNFDINICYGQTYSMGDIVYDSTSVYQIVTISSEGCHHTVNLDLTISSEIALFDTTIIPDYGNSSGRINLKMRDSTVNYTYLWSNGDTTPNISNLAFGIYAVTVSDSIGCFEIFEFEVLLKVNTNFINNENLEIRIFPNPISVTDFININIKAIEKSDLEISILNVNGQVLQTRYQTIEKGENQIQLIENLPKGIYFILIKNKENKLMERLPIFVQ